MNDIVGMHDLPSHMQAPSPKLMARVLALLAAECIAEYMWIIVLWTLIAKVAMIKIEMGNYNYCRGAGDAGDAAMMNNLSIVLPTIAAGGDGACDCCTQSSSRGRRG